MYVEDPSVSATLTNNGGVFGHGYSINVGMFGDDNLGSDAITVVIDNNNIVAGHAKWAHVTLEGGDAESTGDVTNIITNADGLYGHGKAAHIGIIGGDNNGDGATVTNILTNTGEIAGKGEWAHVGIWGGQLDYNTDGIVVNTIDNESDIKAKASDKAEAGLWGGDAHADSDGSVTNKITNGTEGDLEALSWDGAAFAGIYGGDIHYLSNADMTNTLGNDGYISAKASDFAEAGIFGGDAHYEAGYYEENPNNLTNTIANGLDGEIDALSWDGVAKAGLWGGDAGKESYTDVTNTIGNSGDISAKASHFAEAGIFGGSADWESYGDVTNTASNGVDGTIEAKSWDGAAKAGLWGGDLGGYTYGNLTNTLGNDGEISAKAPGFAEAGIFGGDAEYRSGYELDDPSTLTNTLVNGADGTLEAKAWDGAAKAGIFGGDAHYESYTDLTNTLINNGDINAKAPYFAEAGIFGGDANYSSYGTVTNNIINNGSIVAGTWDGSAIAGLFGGDQHSNDNNNGTPLINTIVNTGTIYSWGDDPTTEIRGGKNYSDDGSVVNNMFVGGTVSSSYNGYTLVKGGSAHGDGDVTNNIIIGGTVTSKDTDDTYDNFSGVDLENSYTQVQGGNNHGDGTVTNNIVVTGTVNGDILPGQNYAGYSNTTTNTTVLAGWSPTVTGIIFGDNSDDNDPYDANGNNLKSPNDGGSLDQLIFAMQTTNEGQWDQWQHDINTLIIQNGGVIPTSGTINWGGKTYTWENIDELQDLVKFLLIVTWFDPNDGRYNGQPADRIVIYCHADKNDLGVLLVNNDSKGNIGTSFDIKKLEALGKGGTTVSFGNEGTLSIMMDNQGNGYAAWNGGIEGANGQGDFAKTFVCPLPQ